ncbi:NlpC/P60 family protein [Treponema pectinovorum]|uniref:NlpC/P60 family protein n=1 Tax=Treponema pectinovorum TaxID=164 RepID=UPI0011C80C7D|nr:NlpC/P60 family protein [Treponema pectinovorum]
MFEWVHKYVGIPFCSSGRDFTGVDCYGLVRLILNNEYGYDLPLLTGNYSDALDKKQTQKLFDLNVPVFCAEKISTPEEQSVALIKSRGLATHVALYAGDGFIIHAVNRLGSVCERISNSGLSGTIEGWYHVNKNSRST